MSNYASSTTTLVGCLCGDRELLFTVCGLFGTLRIDESEEIFLSDDLPSNEIFLLMKSLLISVLMAKGVFAQLGLQRDPKLSS